jgi:hypothetical protein
VYFSFFTVLFSFFLCFHYRSLIEVIAVLNEQVDNMNRHKGEIGKNNNDIYSALKVSSFCGCLFVLFSFKDDSHSRLHSQLQIVKRVIEEVVSFQHGGLNNSLDTMSEVIKEYNRSREEIKGLRKSLIETQTVLTSKKSGQITLKELWAKKVELKESLRMVRELEDMKVSNQTNEGLAIIMDLFVFLTCRTFQFVRIV